MDHPESLIDQLSDFKAWRDGGPAVRRDPFTLIDYVGCVATPDLVIAFANLYHPALIEHKKLFFLKGKFSVVSYLEWETAGSAPLAIQRTMNHLHMTTLIQGTEMSMDLARHCALTIATMWSTTLATYGVRGEVIDGEMEDLAVTLVNRETTR